MKGSKRSLVKKQIKWLKTTKEVALLQIKSEKSSYEQERYFVMGRGYVWEGGMYGRGAWWLAMGVISNLKIKQTHVISMLCIHFFKASLNWKAFQIAGLGDYMYLLFGRRPLMIDTFLKILVAYLGEQFPFISICCK